MYLVQNTSARSKSWSEEGAVKLLCTRGLLELTILHRAARREGVNVSSTSLNHSPFLS